MAFYESQEFVIAAIAELITKHISHSLAAVTSAVRSREDLFKIHSDLYSRALLVSGIKDNSSPVFANVPHTDFQFYIRNELEALFVFLDLPTNQAEIFRLERIARSNKLHQEISINDLVKFPRISKKLIDIFDWIELARHQIIQMHENLSTLGTPTPEQIEFAKLFEFDWYYEYSDDRSVRLAGDKRHRKAIAAINAALENNPALQCVLIAIGSSDMHVSVDFFTQEF